MGVSKNRVENPIKMDDLGSPSFWKHPNWPFTPWFIKGSDPIDPYQSSGPILQALPSSMPIRGLAACRHTPWTCRSNSVFDERYFVDVDSCQALLNQDKVFIISEDDVMMLMFCSHAELPLNHHVFTPR